jgi:hypothetical protein
MHSWSPHSRGLDLGPASRPGCRPRTNPPPPIARPLPPKTRRCTNTPRRNLRPGCCRAERRGGPPDPLPTLGPLTFARDARNVLSLPTLMIAVTTVVPRFAGLSHGGFETDDVTTVTRRCPGTVAAFAHSKGPIFPLSARPRTEARTQPRPSPRGWSGDGPLAPNWRRFHGDRQGRGHGSAELDGEPSVS